MQSSLLYLNSIESDGSITQIQSYVVTTKPIICYNDLNETIAGLDDMFA